jgi:PAS domain S-box-containing protein
MSEAISRIFREQSMSTPPDKPNRKLRRRAEEKLVLSGPPKSETLTAVDAQRLLHELQVHQIEVEMQNEELRHAIDEKEAMEALYRDLYEFAPVGYFNLDHVGIIHSVNLTGTKLLGVERGLLVHKRLDAFISDETRRQFHEFLKKVFADDLKQTCEAAFVTKHKSPLYVQIEAVVTESRKNCRAVIIDITERKLAVEAASQSQKIFYDLIERSPFGTYVVDSQFRIAIMNTVSQQGAFREVRPVIGHDFAEAIRILWPEDVAVDIIGHFRHTLDTGEPYRSRDFINPRHDKVNVEAYEWELHRLMLPDGQYGVICYFYDSTKLRQVEAALRESEERYRLLAETMLQGVVHQNADGTIISMNPAAERILGKSREELLGSTSVNVEHQTIRENGEYFPGLEHPAMVALQTGQPVADVVMGVFNPRLAEYRWINVNAVPVYRQNDTSPSEVYAVFEDITERKRADEALMVLNQELESRVAGRTSELADTVGKLKAEIVEREIAEEKLLRLNRLYLVLSETKHVIVHTKDRDTLLENVCRIAVEDGGFMLAWVGLLQEEGNEVQVTASFGATGYLQNMRISATEELIAMGPTGIAVRTDTCCICNDFLASPMTRPWHEQGATYGIRA